MHCQKATSSSINNEKWTPIKAWAEVAILHSGVIVQKVNECIITAHYVNIAWETVSIKAVADLKHLLLW